MKINKKLMRLAVITAVMDAYKFKDIAKATVDAISEDNPGAVEVQDTKGNGFILRKTKDVALSDQTLFTCLASAIKTLIDEKSDDIVDFMQDHHDVTYDEKYVDADFASDIFDVSRNGRLIYIEVDI